MWTYAGILAIAVGALLIWSVLVKKFPQLKLIDLSTLAKERHAMVKSRIIRERFDRSLKHLEKRSRGAIGGFTTGAQGLYERLRGKIAAIDPDSRNPDESRGLQGSLQHEEPALPLPEPASSLITRALEMASVGDHESAETMLIEALKHDAKDYEAYRGLASVYAAQRLYDQARETLEFAVRLHDDAPVHHDVRADLGALYLETGEPALGQEQFRMALEAEPYNPRYLDYFLEASLLVGDRAAAERAFEVLETANPDNRKLADFRERIDAIRQPETEPEIQPEMA